MFWSHFLTRTYTEYGLISFVKVKDLAVFTEQVDFS